jgi:predicted O-linked N-acetylglucosamine transferase (SPINDLY family)
MTHTPEPRALSALRRAATLHAGGHLREAETLYQEVLRWEPMHWHANYFLGLIALQTARPARAAELIGRALARSSDNAEAQVHHGIALHQLERYADAIASYDRAIALSSAEPRAHEHRGHACGALRLWGAAVESYDRAILHDPSRADLHVCRGTALFYLQRHAAALADFDRAIGLNPSDAAAYNNRGNILREMKRLEAALADYHKAISLQAEYADAYYNRGNVLRESQRHEAAIESFDKAAALKPGLKSVHTLRCYTRMQICDWDRPASPLEEIEGLLDRNQEVANPFFVLALSGSARLQRKAAENWVRQTYPEVPALPAIRAYPRGERIRIAYCSADFHDHATMYLMAELFELHDQTKFELTFLSFGCASNGWMRQRLAGVRSDFLDVRALSDPEIAALARARQIDIAVDLKGFTQDHRARIFAHRAAPLQVSYLGYAGTMGAAYMDYLIADHTLVPEGGERHYCEKIIRLPHSYQVNDRKRPLAGKIPERRECGLPEQGFVFCCFNNVYKITRDTFDGWMRILGRVDGSVLWLLEDNPGALDNLRRAGQRRGIAAERLVFAAQLALPEHLARQRIADLFLDTLPYNAHTTASDALWAGLPVLTRPGEAFAGRVAASLLGAVGAPELIVSTQEQYEERAVELASQPQRLEAIRAKLTANRLAAPLFDTPRFARHIEAAYRMIYERSQAGLPPQHIEVPAE